MTALDQPVISVHFPKTSGTSFRIALQAALGDDNVIGSYDCDPLDPANPCWIHPAWFLRNCPRDIQPYRALHGHIRIHKYDLLPAAYRITMLREPVENLISIYFFWRSIFENNPKGHAIYEFVRERSLSLLETAEIPGLRRLMSATYFGDFDMRRFDVIGIYDRRAAFFSSVSKLLGVTIAADIEENVTPPSEERGNLVADTRLMARLRDLLQDDIRFYEAHSGGGGRFRWAKPFFSKLAGPKPRAASQ